MKYIPEPSFFAIGVSIRTPLFVNANSSWTLGVEKIPRAFENSSGDLANIPRKILLAAASASWACHANAKVVTVLDDLLLQSYKGSFAFTIEEREVDSEQAKQTVRDILFSRCLTVGSLGHDLGDGRVRIQSFILDGRGGHSGDA